MLYLLIISQLCVKGVSFLLTNNYLLNLYDYKKDYNTPNEKNT